MPAEDQASPGGVAGLRGCSPERVLGAARRLARSLDGYCDRTMTPVLVRVCAGEAVSALGLPESTVDMAARLLVRHWLDRKPDKRDMMRMALRLAACREDLRNGDLPAMWMGDPPAWTCAQVSQVVGLPRLAEVTFVGMTGVLAGEALTYRLGTGYVMRLIRELGAPRFAELELRDLLGFFLLAKFGQNRYQRQYLLQTAIPSGMRNLNRKLYRRRHNVHCDQEEGR